jgi:hypothetical protein
MSGSEICKMRFLLLSVVICCGLFSCEKEPTLFENSCEQTIMNTLSMVPIDGNHLNCELHLLKFTKGIEIYFAVGSHCMDYILILMDCNGEKAFSSNETQDDFLRGAYDHGIVAYQPK